VRYLERTCSTIGGQRMVPKQLIGRIQLNREVRTLLDRIA
jgi:hypothetical protein